MSLGNHLVDAGKQVSEMPCAFGEIFQTDILIGSMGANAGIFNTGACDRHSQQAGEPPHRAGAAYHRNDNSGFAIDRSCRLCRQLYERVVRVYTGRTLPTKVRLMFLRARVETLSTTFCIQLSNSSG